MGAEPNNDVNEYLSGLSEEELENLADDLEDDKEDDLQETLEDQYGMTKDVQESYADFDKDEKHNAHSFLHRATFESDDTTRTTWLAEHEIGKPHFTVRTLLDLEDISKYYLDPFIKAMGMSPQRNNGISNYFRAKVLNITDSGMSNKGFAMNLNVTQKRDSTKQRIKELAQLGMRKKKVGT